MKKNLPLLIILLVFVFSLFSFSPVLAATKAEDGPYGLQGTADAAKLDMKGDLASLVGKMLGRSLTLVGVIFLGLMIYGGISWMLSRGNEEQSKKALNTITAAIIGLIIVTASYAITNFVFGAVGGANNTGCSKNSDCLDGFICNVENGQCVNNAG